jgi:hypothetical protein
VPEADSSVDFCSPRPAIDTYPVDAQADARERVRLDLSVKNASVTLSTDQAAPWPCRHRCLINFTRSNASNWDMSDRTPRRRLRPLFT